MEEYEPLQEEYKLNGMTLKLVKKERNVAMLQVITSSGRPSGYEVHLIRYQKGRTRFMYGKEVTFKQKEALRGNEEFGTYAWHLATLERAEEVFRFMLEKGVE